MKLKKCPLPGRETTHVHDTGRFNAHSLERRPMSDRRKDQIAAIFKSDETTIEEVINVRSEKQSVLAVKALLIGRIAPWLAMACDQVCRIFHPGYPASDLNLTDSLLKKTLSSARPDDRLSVSFLNPLIVLELLLKRSLPIIKIISRNRPHLPSRQCNRINLATDHSQQHIGKIRRQFRQVD